MFIAMYKCVFSTLACFSPAPLGLFSRTRLRGTQGGRLYTTAQVCVPAGLRGVCSGCSKSRNLANNHGLAFRGARAEHDNGKSTCQLFRSNSVKALYHTLWQPYYTSSCTSSVCGPCGPLLRVRGHSISVSVLCVCLIRVHDYK